jgi:hypothetical protein
LGVLFRPRQAARESSHAAARIALEPAAHGVRVTVLKSRGGVRGSIELRLFDLAGARTSGAQLR